MKDNSSSSTSGIKQKDTKPADLNQYLDDKELTLPSLKMVDSEKYLQTFSASQY